MTCESCTFWLQVFLYGLLGLVLIFVIVENLTTKIEKRPTWEPREKEAE